MSTAGSFLITGGTAEERLLVLGSRFTVEKSIFNDPDVRLVDGSSGPIGIAIVRDLIRYIAIAPSGHPEKTVGIIEAQNLTEEAQNALLKTLEEPPEHVRIILLVSDSDSLLPTVISRCQIIPLTEKPAFGLDEKEKKELSIILEDMAKGDIGEKLKAASVIATSREEALKWLDKLLVYFHGALTEEPKALSLRLDLVYRIFMTKRYLKANSNVRLTIENLLLNW